MAEDTESDIAIRFVDENDYREISAKAVSAKWKLINESNESVRRSRAFLNIEAK